VQGKPRLGGRWEREGDVWRKIRATALHTQIQPLEFFS
jgi:hypothetical protein